MIGSHRVDDGEAVGEKESIAANEIIAALDGDGVERAIWAEIIRHDQSADQIVGLKDQVIARHWRNTADPVGAQAEISAGTAVPALRCRKSILRGKRGEEIGRA